MVKIYARDLKRLKAIGNRNWKKGFYALLKSAEELWITTADLKRLRSLSDNNNARTGLLNAMSIAEERLAKETDPE
jgi:hypothetical protein